MSHIFYQSHSLKILNLINFNDLKVKIYDKILIIKIKNIK